MNNIIIYIFTFQLDPLSRFPQGGKALGETPSPLGEGRDGGFL
jgi:hypothetical protein